MSSLSAAIWAALEALADGELRLAESILLGAVEDASDQLGTANPVMRPGGWPGERTWR